MADAARHRHQAADGAAQQRRAAPDSLPSSASASAKPIEMPAPMRGGEADQERVPGVVRREGGGEHRRQRRNRAVHQPDEAGLDDLQDEAPARVLVLVLDGASSVRNSSSILDASRSCLSSATARSPSSLRMPASVARVAARR